MRTIAQNAAAALNRLSPAGQQEMRGAIARGLREGVEHRTRMGTRNVGTAMGSDNLAIASSRALSASEREAAAAAITGLVQARGLKPQGAVDVGLHAFGDDVHFRLPATRESWEGPISVQGAFNTVKGEIKELAGLLSSGAQARTSPFTHPWR